MKEGGWELLAVTTIILYFFIILSQQVLAPGGGCGDGICALGEHCGDTGYCSGDCGGCPGFACIPTAQQLCDQGICCGGTCQAEFTCTPGTTTTEGCGFAQYKVCSADGCGWSACQTDCSTPNFCPAASEVCKYRVSCTATGGCVLGNKPAGTSCTFYGATAPTVCNTGGACTWYQCEGRTAESIFCSATTVSGAIALGDNNPDGYNYYYCPGSHCYQCASDRTYNLTTGQCDLRCTSTCTTQGQTACEGSNLKTCTLQSTGCLAWTTTACASGVCSGNACCTPEPITATCGTSNCGSKVNNCGQTVNCGTCPTGQYCSSTTPGVPGICHTACTPSCPPAGDVACNQPITDGCGGTCTGTGTKCTSPAICTPHGCQTFSIGLTYEGTTTPIPDPLPLTAGTTVNVKPTLTGTVETLTYDVTWKNILTTGVSRYAYFPVTATTGDISAALTYRTLTFVAKSGTLILASKSVVVNVQCSVGDPCYCAINSTAGCMTQYQNSITGVGYCAAGYCRTCTSGYYSNTTACVQCTTASQCAVTDADCQIPSCGPGGTCSAIPKTDGTLCNGGGGTCQSGVCNGCDPGLCKAKDTSVIELGSSYIDGCTNVTSRTLVMTNHSCSGSSCTPTVTRVELEPLREAAADGTTSATCGGTQACQLGQCVPKGCLDGSICNELEWEGNLSVCNGVITGMCATDLQCTRPVIDHSCTAENVPGLCKAQGSCIAKCPADLLPGCKASSGANYQDTGLACASGQACYTCAPSHVYKLSDGTCVPSTYSLDFSGDSGVMREDLYIVPELSDPNGKVGDDFQYRLTTTALNQSLDSFGSFTVRVDEPGIYPATLTASRKATGVAVASVTKPITITCSPGNACCPAGTTGYLPEGSGCSVDNVPGTCRNRQCDLSCVIESYSETGTDSQGMERCNNGRDDDCNGLTDCYEPICQSFCGNIRCPPGSVICSDACADLKSDNLNCGTCGKRCKPDERCTESACVQIPGCEIVCNSDRDCGRGMICINAGDCTNSYCTKPNIIEQNETDIRAIGQVIAQTRTHRITKELIGDELRITVQNLAPVPLRGFNLTVNIPKEMAQDASELGADQVFYVIMDDPVIEFRFSQVGSKQLVVIDLPRAVDASLINSVYVSGAHDPLSDEIFTLTPDDITITSNLVTEAGKSRILVGIDPHSRLYGVRIPVHIPKCVAESVKDIRISGQYEIILDDPLVVWTFDSLTSKETLEIEVGKEIGSMCSDQLTAFAVADLVDEPANPWLPLLLIPALGAAIVFFQRFHAGPGERMERKEFEALARQQGHTRDEIEQAWREYEKKW